MKNLDEINQILSAYKTEIKEKLKVRSTGVFGSYIRGKQRKNSNNDVLVEFSEPIGLMEASCLISLLL